MGRGRATLARAFSISGVGLHTGVSSQLTVSPSLASTGRVFVRVDLPGAPEIPATLEHVVDTTRAVRLERGPARVETVEHLLAALAALGVDDARIEIDGPEVPAVDGSAKPFVEAIERVGVDLDRERPRRALRVTGSVEIEEGPRRAAWLPGRGGLELDVTVAFPEAGILEQRWRGRVDPESFVRAIAPARTFGLAGELSALRAAGLARGATTDNALLLDRGGPAFGAALRFSDEPVRHKVLDAVGDLALLGAPIDGRLRLHLAGHRLHVAALRALVLRTDAVRWVDG